MKLRRLFGRDDATGDDEDGLDAAPPEGGVDDEPPAAEPERDEEVGQPDVVDDMVTELADTDGAGDADAVAGDGAAAEKAADEDGDAVESDEHEVPVAEEAEDIAEGDEDGDESDEEREPTGQIEFELSDWGSRERKLLDEALTAVRVRRAWEAGTLVVAASDAEVVDDLIDDIEERLALDLSPDVEPVIYDVGDWPLGLEDRFIEALIEQRIAHARGYREVTVALDDEERVDALIEDVTKAWEDEQVTDDEIGGPDAQDVLSELFVSADRLLHDASDRAATVRFDDAAGSATTMAVPFGFAEDDWQAITDLVVALRELLSEAGTGDEEIVEAATALRSHLRPLV
ncbi:hypothetical protein [Iamia sp.]|uniref:hypothetical protein n=1 Tax=Iamia sp. TaxID=2722710 RepID=UPI002B77C174|nr:hypothetical protein [Iamia sp.]HXH55854.1 hypothetical protein [Iamia sp.]